MGWALASLVPKKAETNMNDDRFWYWINERERIRRSKESGAVPPWTDDPIFQEWRFTNVRREDDAVTRFLSPYRIAFSVKPIIQWLPMRIMALRFFNRIDVLEELLACPGLWSDQQGINTGRLQKWLRRWRPNGPWTTGAFIINSPNGMDKLAGVCWMIKESRGICKALAKDLIATPESWNSMEAVTGRLTRVQHVADFMAYEVACDLRYTDLMNDPPDRLTWANPGPGAKRGLARIHERTASAGIYKDHLIGEMVQLLRLAPERVDDDNLWQRMELREIEHSLCEYDKYERVATGEGTPRQRYRYVAK